MNDEQEKVQARIHSLGQQIRAHRIAQNLSQQRLALMVHTDQAVIARIEAGKHNTASPNISKSPMPSMFPWAPSSTSKVKNFLSPPHQSSERAKGSCKLLSIFPVSF